MTKEEILSQPETWGKTVAFARQKAGGFPRLNFGGYDRIYTVGSGSSYYLGLTMQSLIAKKYPVSSAAVPSCETFLDSDRYFRAGRKYLAFINSRSGRSTEALIAAEHIEKNFGARIVTLGCYSDSPLSQKGADRLIAEAGQEKSVVMTRSFSNMLLLFALYLELTRGAGDEASANEASANGAVGTAVREAFAPWADELPGLGAALLERYHEPIRTLISRSHFDHFVFLGSGAFYGLAREAALKMQEMAIASAEAYHLLEYRHGPKSVANSGTLAVAFLLPGFYEYQASLLREIEGFGATVVTVGPENDAGASEAADLAVRLPAGLNEYQSLILELPVIHLLGLYEALKRGVDPDNPQHLTQVVEL